MPTTRLPPFLGLPLGEDELDAVPVELPPQALATGAMAATAPSAAAPLSRLRRENRLPSTSSPVPLA